MTNVLCATFRYIPRCCRVVKFAVDTELRVVGESVSRHTMLGRQVCKIGVYNKHNSGPKTDPCGTEHVICMMEDEARA